MSEKDWEQIRTWRRTTRAELLAQRYAVPSNEKQRIQLVLNQQLREAFPELQQAAIGFYWPIKGEIDLTPLISDLVTEGAVAALPVIVDEKQPMQFWKWSPGMKLGRGLWNIPVPTQADLVPPTVLLVPFVGFDKAGYRLGYGGGYYDRSLSVMKAKPMTIGVGYEIGTLETIYPQPHDIPLDAIVTESRVVRFDRAAHH